MVISAAIPVGRKTADAGREARARVRALKVGPGTDPEAEMGPLITKGHRAKVISYIDSGIAKGGKLLVDGGKLNLQGYDKGYFVGNSLFDHVTPAMRIHKEEIFGPVLAVARVENFEDAARMVNEHEFGNGTAIFTRDGDAALEFAHQIKMGMVGINFRSDPGADGLPFLRRMESVAVRRSPHVRSRRRQVLYVPEDYHEPMADRYSRRRRVRHAQHAVTRLRELDYKRRGERNSHAFPPGGPRTPHGGEHSWTSSAAG